MNINRCKNIWFDGYRPGANLRFTTDIVALRRLITSMQNGSIFPLFT
ncbi:hypothetical protein [Chondrinema litorale]|nr:hypothetical protein [Chondrinema litorale]UZR96481.1 hypothetical protein OQ292_22755 [Chondrinema litorale]